MHKLFPSPKGREQLLVRSFRPTPQGLSLSPQADQSCQNPSTAKKQLLWRVTSLVKPAPQPEHAGPLHVWISVSVAPEPHSSMATTSPLSVSMHALERSWIPLPQVAEQAFHWVQASRAEKVILDLLVAQLDYI